MSRVDNLHELPHVFMVDNNKMVCQAAQNCNGHTVIVLVTPQDAWVKKLIITATNVYGYTLACGDHAGAHMYGLNYNMKFNKVDLGGGCQNVAIQFVKPKFLEIDTDYVWDAGHPQLATCYTIVFFWPNDAAGDHWNIFLQNLAQTQHAVNGVTGVTSRVVQVGQDASAFRNLFA